MLGNPLLKRDVKFSDPDMTLEMDFNLGDGNWRTIGVEEAREALKLAKAKMARNTKRDLADLLRSPDQDQDLISDSDQDDTMVEVSDNEDDVNKNAENSLKVSSLTAITANARLLVPKLESLFDCMSERSVDFAVITETWLQPGKQLEDIKDELSNAYSLTLIARCRAQAAQNSRTYGGVAFVYRQSRGSFKEFVIANPNNYEVLATVGKIAGIKSKIFCLPCYAPPNMGSLRARGMTEYISDLVAEAKRLYGDVLVLISGDFNQWSVHDMLQDHPDMAEVSHGPTRQGRYIDRSFVNFNRSVVGSGTSVPLEDEDGRESDHRVAPLRAEFETTENKKIKSVAFVQLNWKELFGCPLREPPSNVFECLLV